MRRRTSLGRPLGLLSRTAHGVAVANDLDAVRCPQTLNEVRFFETPAHVDSDGQRESSKFMYGLPLERTQAVTRTLASHPVLSSPLVVRVGGAELVAAHRTGAVLLQPVHNAGTVEKVPAGQATGRLAWKKERQTEGK